MSESENKTPKVIIQKPIQGKHSTHVVPIEGIAYDLPSTSELWVVKEPFPGDFHPDDGPAIFEGNKWYATAYIGNAKPHANQDQKFKIHIIMASSNSKAAQKYRDYLRTARSKGWPGLQNLYGGEIVATVVVVRDDNMPKEPKIVYKHISDKNNKNWIRFCLVQLDYNLAATSLPADFGWKISDDDAVKDKVFKALKKAQSERVNIICFPELSFSRYWINEIAHDYNDIIIICGSYYQDSYNICQIIINGYILNPPYRKCTPSISETDAVTGRGMKSGNMIYIIQTEHGRFSVLTCSDYPQHSERICKYNEECKGVDFIINPCCDYNLERFQEKASSDCDIFALDVIQVNKAPEGNKYGKSCIIGREHDEIKNRLINEKFRSKFDVRHKLCEIDHEQMVIVDIDIGKKGPLAGIETDYRGRIRINRKNFFKYKNDWMPCELEAKSTSAAFSEERAIEIAKAQETATCLENEKEILDKIEIRVLREMEITILSSIDYESEKEAKVESNPLQDAEIYFIERGAAFLDEIKREEQAAFLKRMDAVASEEMAIEIAEAKETAIDLETEKEILDEIEIQALQKEEGAILGLMDREANKEAEIELDQWKDTNIYLVEEKGVILCRAIKEERAAFLKKMDAVAKEEMAIETAEAKETATDLETEKEILDEIEIQALQKEEGAILGLIDLEASKDIEIEFELDQDTDIHLIEEQGVLLIKANKDERDAFLKTMDAVAKEEKAIEIEEAKENATDLETEKEILDEIEIRVLREMEITILSLMDYESYKEAKIEINPLRDAEIYFIERGAAFLNTIKKEKQAAFLKRMDAVASEEMSIEIAEAKETATDLETENEILNEIEIQALQKEEGIILDLMNREANNETEIEFDQLEDTNIHLVEEQEVILSMAIKEERAEFLKNMDALAKEEKAIEDY